MREKTAQQNKVRFLSLAVVVICMLLSTRVARAKRNGTFTLGDFQGVSAQQAEEAWQETQDVNDLVYLLKVLCYQAEVEKDSDVADKIASYGTALFDRAKAGLIDLEEMGEDDETLLELLRLIREHGAS